MVSEAAQLPKKTSKNEEPLWVKQHAAKLEKETSKTPQLLVLAKCNNGKNDGKHERRKHSVESHSHKETNKHSLWDSPVFSRKFLNPPVTTDPGAKPNDVCQSETLDMLPNKTFKPPNTSLSITSRIEEVERLLTDPIVEKSETMPVKAPGK